MAIKSEAEDMYEGDYDEEEEQQDLVVSEYEIIASPNDFNIKTIYDFIKSGTVKIPAFQRNFVWDIKRSSKLIESIIMGLPIPQLFLYEKARNEFLVIDGQQRLMSIYYFVERRFPLKEKRIALRRIFAEKGLIPEKILHDDEYFTDFNLKLSEAIPGKQSKFNGLNYSTLDEYKTTFDLRTIRNIIIKQTAPAEDDSCIYEIFNRLNTGGVNLRPQEIRTSLYQSKFYTLLYQLNLESRWRELLDIPDPDLYMKDIEILLRGFAMLLDSDNYKPSMLRFLNSFSNSSKNYSQEMIDYYKKLFLSFLGSCSDLKNDAFLTQRGRFNISVYESVFRAICLYAVQNNTIVSKKIDPEKLRLLKNDKAFIDATQSSIASTANVRMRLSLADTILNTYE